MSGYSQITYCLQEEPTNFGAEDFEPYKVFVCQNIPTLLYCILLTRPKDILNTSQ